MNWKFIKFSTLLVLLFVLSVQPVLAAGKTEKIKVTFVSADLVQNNSVGNEWWWGAFVNGKELSDGSSVTIKADSNGTIKLRAEAQEQDKYPDDGVANTTVKVSSIKSSFSKKITVAIVENRGRYSGNTAKMEFVFKLEKIN
ncbi:hypothetical protein [Paenibacillus macquariensis]|uniref:Uncharacterized protein n=1 Tax=Paenibacillus macquariensis TaxID=948756 RepID=A0ABY1JUI9_9BACL|nr:hypothetical protein [Paenibacillus macquariensis]MEC0090933.1 hypothetical protein [Paenibacillus macquariensis]OAB34660.1 hypothetical protein PMSM_12475 [Paenibacillus macquariensis subsp. macquariensis]SIQ80399.1 hypothetical protein SAMN05421578_104124 [Paenibacillus macquariensis]